MKNLTKPKHRLKKLKASPTPPKEGLRRWRTELASSTKLNLQPQTARQWLCALGKFPFWGFRGLSTHYLCISLVCWLLSPFGGAGGGFAQNIGINATGAAPDASALLDVDAAPTNNKGLLLPRLSTTQRNAIVAPAQSLLIYNTTDSCYQGYIGTQWISFGCVGSGTPPPPPSYCGVDTITIVVDVTNPTTGKIWMDRNLGASQVATSSTYVPSYGDLYQWGRCSDGHEKRTSGTTSTLSSSDTPGHANFILAPSSPFDWRSPQNVNLWQGVGGINNPCPAGYRIPTDAELDAERLSWSTNNAAGAFASPLKLPMAGRRDGSTGSISTVGFRGFYYTSTVSGTDSRYLDVNSGGAGMSTNNGAVGSSVRCLKD